MGGAGTGDMDKKALKEAYRDSLGLRSIVKQHTAGNTIHSTSQIYIAGVLTSEETADFMKSKHFEDLLSKDRLPTRADLMDAAHRWRGKPVSWIDKSIPPPNKVPQVKSCVSCHAGPEAVMPIPFDPGSIAQWKERLESDSKDKKEEALNWLETTLAHLKNGTMPPPPLRTHLGDQEKKTLVEYLGSKKK